MDDGTDSGYPTPRDDHQTSTPKRPGSKPSLTDHFPQTPFQLENTSQPSSPEAVRPFSPTSTTACDTGLTRNLIQSEREKLKRCKVERSLEEALNRSESEVARKDREIFDLRTEIDAKIGLLEESRIHEEEEKKQLMDRIDRLEDEMKQSQIKLKESKDAFIGLKRHLEQAEKDKAEFQSKVLELEKAQEDKNNELREKHKEITNLCDMKTQLENKLHEINQSLLIKNEEVTESSMIQDKYDILTESKEALEKGLRQAEGDCHKLDSRILELMSSIEKLNVEKIIMEKKLDEISRDMANKDEENVALQSELHILKGEFDTIKEMNCKYQECYEKSQMQLSQQKAKELAMEEKITSFRRQLEFKNEELNTRLKHVEELQTERDDLHVQLVEQRTKMTEKHHKDVAAYDELTALRLELDHIKDERKNILGQNECLQKQIHDLKKNLSDLTEGKQRLKKEKEELQCSKEEVERQLTDQGELKRLLVEAQSTAEVAVKERTAAVLSEDKWKEELRIERKKAEDLEAINAHFVQQDMKVSSEVTKLRKEVTSEQKKRQKLSDELVESKKRLEETQKEIEKILQKVRETEQMKKNNEELSTLNEKITVEIDYLRKEVNDRPKWTVINNQKAQFQSELARKDEEIADLLKRIETFSLSINKNQEDACNEIAQLRHQIEQEMTIKEKLLEEFDNYKTSKEAELIEFVAKLDAAGENNRMLHYQLQDIQDHIAVEGSTIWDNLPESIRNNIPENVIEALKVLRISRNDILSSADSQESLNKMLNENNVKLAEMIEQFLQNNSSNSLSTNILQAIGTLLRTFSGRESVTGLSQIISQLIKKHERSYENLLEEQRKIEKSKIRELNERIHHLVRSLDEEKKEKEILHAEITTMRTELQSDRNGVLYHEEQIHKLRSELAALREKEYEYQASIKEAYAKATETCNEYENDFDKMHLIEKQLHERILRAEAETEQVKRQNLSLETHLHQVELRNSSLEKEMKEIEKRAEETQKKYKEKEQSVRFNQDTMRICLENIDEHKKAIEYLQRRNRHRQDILNRIYNDLQNFSSIRDREMVRNKHIQLLENSFAHWKSSEEQQNKKMEAQNLAFNKTIHERRTPELRTAFQEKFKHNKENV